MKSLLKFLPIAFFALLCFTSCQEEVFEETPINEEQLLVANSTLANLVQSTSERNGSIDNILDNANCLSINLPVTVIVNDITITINTLEDLELIEDIFEEFENDDDILELLFPITIVLNDHTEIVINNEDELDAFVEQCTDDSDDDIECIDFQYPISFSIFNTDFQIIETVFIENDRQLYQFLERLENSDSGAILASLNFPVTMVYANGETIEVNDNQELQRVLNDAREDCTEEESCRKEEVDMYLQRCHWEVYRYNGDDHFRDYDVFFKENGELNIISENATVAITGLWNTSVTNAGLVLSISELTEFDEDLGGNWLIVECDDDRFELVREATGSNERTHIVIKKECEEDPGCTAQEVRMFLNECHWFGGSNLIDTGATPPGKFYFRENGVLVVVNPNLNEEFVGTWDVELTDVGIILVMELPEPYNELSRRWKLFECGEHRVKLISGDHYIIFERDCDISCTELDVDSFLLECVWNVVTFNGDDHLINYDLDFNDVDGINITDINTNDVFTGFWSTSQTNDGVLVQFANINGPNIQAISGDWIVVDCRNDRLKLQNNSGDFFVIEQDCN